MAGIDQRPPEAKPGFKFIQDWSDADVKSFVKQLDETHQISDFSEWEIEFIGNVVGRQREYSAGQRAVIGALAMRYNDLLNS